MRMIQSLLFALTLLLSGTAAVDALAQDSGHGSLEQLVVESAESPKQHEALASFYSGKAKEMRESAAEHRSMGNAYSANKMVQRDRMRKHCSDLAANFDKAADDFEAMAKVHEEAAKP